MPSKLIGCLSTRNEIMEIGLPANMDCEFLDFSLHAVPNELHQQLQQRIDASQIYDTMTLIYGSCSHALNGLVSEAVPLVLPMAHDCISLLLGSDRRRQELSATKPAAYYFSQGWLEYGRDPYTEYREYREQYGEEDARYLIQTLYGTYREAVLIKTCEGEKLLQCRQKVRKIAEFFGWEVSEVAGDLSLLTALLNRQEHPDVLRFAPGIPVVLPSCQGD